jgi:pantoate--beta-alanine ligase
MLIVRIAKKHCDRVVVSIFVNPAQFAPHEDFNKYPRTLDNDVALLAAQGCDAVFAPSASEMYPSGITQDRSKQVGTFIEVLGLSHQLEGSIRPDHFRGVATVVMKLFNAVQPDIAVFGQKDAQQCVVLRRMMRDLLMNMDMIVGATLREKDGLAMSSRNRYLSPNEREIAPILYEALMAGKKCVDEGGETRRSKILAVAQDVIAREPSVELQYLSLASPTDLSELDTISPGHGAIFSVAIRLGNTRLIDNLLINCRL